MTNTEPTNPPPTGSAPAMPAPTTGAPSVGVRPTTAVTTGTLIMGTYEIETLINSGGMGEVYRGRNIHNGEPVAIKIVLPTLAHDPKIVALFQKESTVLSRLSHEAIVRYHVFTNDPTIGRPCMVMEFVSGTSLSDRLEQGPMPVEDVKVMLRRVASGLDKAHRAGVVHRDLSPDNVILEDGLVDHAKLIDFGIAKSTNIGAGTLLQGQFAGKFNWVAPEQLGAFGGVVDGRSDIYSLGLITAAVCRGEVLQMGASIVDAVGKRAAVPDLTGVHPEMVPLLTYMLNPDPAKRPENMAAVIAALDNPALIPSAEPAAAPDPNRTIIAGSLPPIPMPVSQPSPAPVSTSPLAAEMSNPPVAADRGGASSPPAGATVIAAPPRVTAPPAGSGTVPPVAAEPDDMASPFGSPSSAPKAVSAPVAMPAEPSAKKGSGGLIAALGVLLVVGGGAGAYFGGVFGPGPTPPDVVADAPKAADPAPVPEPKPEPAPVPEPKPEPEPTPAPAAEPAAPAQPTAEPAPAAEPAAPDPALEAAQAAQAEVRKLAQDFAAVAQENSEAGAKAEGEAAAAEAATEAAVAQEHAAGAIAASQVAQRTADSLRQTLPQILSGIEASSAVPDAAAELAELRKTVTDTAAAAEAVAVAASSAGDRASAHATRLAEAEAAARAAEEAAKADPLTRQRAWLASWAQSSCVLVREEGVSGEALSLEGFATETAPLEAMSAEFQAGTGVVPDVGVRLINETQCAVLDFVNRHAAGNARPVRISMKSTGEVVKSGGTVSGVIEGLEGRTAALFLVSEAGGATNLKQWTASASDGTVSFSFTVSLAPGAPPAPQLLLAIVTDKPLAKLDAVPNGVTVKSLMPFIDIELGDVGVQPTTGLQFFRLEN